MIMITDFKIFEKEFVWTAEDEAFSKLSYAERMNFPYGTKPIKLSYTYHVTPLNNVDNILKYGLTPKKPPIHRDWEPTAIYMSKSPSGVIDLSRQLFYHKRQSLIGHGVKELKTDWVILKINSKNLQMFRDPASVEEGGVYTLNPIPPENISFFHTIDYDIIKSDKNWKDFNNWFIKSGEKPKFIKKFNLKH